MIKEYSEIFIGFDLCYDYSQITFYNRQISEPMTVTTVPGEERYQITTPRDLFPLVEQRAELGIALLSNFFKQCFDMVRTAGPMEYITVMVTMKKMKPAWTHAIVEAMGMLGIPRERVFLQEHLESFYYYALNQKKELWHYHVALFEYEHDRITAYQMSIDYRTKPAFVKVEKVSEISLDDKVRAGCSSEEWRHKKDMLFLEQAKQFMEGKIFSCAYLIGDGFDKKWAQRSLHYLCLRRHVFQGKNLYTKGACYAAMEQAGVANIGNYLFAGEDMLEYNMGMMMQKGGAESYVNMISAGINWYVAHYECEFLLDDTEEIEIYSKSMSGAEMVHTISLKNLPERANLATRLHFEMYFTAKNRCCVRIDDLGLGELCPSSGKKWESIIEL